MYIIITFECLNGSKYVLLLIEIKNFNFYDTKSISIYLKMVNAGKSAVKILQYINAPIIKFVLKQYYFE